MKKLLKSKICGSMNSIQCTVCGRKVNNGGNLYEVWKTQNADGWNAVSKLTLWVCHQWRQFIWGVNTIFVPMFSTYFNFGPYIFSFPILVLKMKNHSHFSLYCHLTKENYTQWITGTSNANVTNKIIIINVTSKSTSSSN